jgi:AraC-like DNA-binding protein
MKNTRYDSREIIEYAALSGISITYENAPTHFPPHWHSAAEFTVILKGHCRYRIGDTVCRASKGDIVLIWPRVLHEVITTPKDGSVFIQFSPTLLEQNLDLVAIYRLMTRCSIIQAEKEPEITAAIAEKVDKIREIFENRDHLSETKCKVLIYEILLLIGEYVLRERGEEFGEDDLTGQAWSYIRNICNVIAERSSEKLTEKDVAAAVGLSPYYFSKLFRKYMQTSFPGYLAGIRVRTAIRLLADKNLSITDCAFQSGFQSTTTFNKAFREITGYSPREYRKLNAGS